MIIGKVTGSIVSTRKNENLVGHKLLIVKPLTCMKVSGECESFVAIDNVGAGVLDGPGVLVGTTISVGDGVATPGFKTSCTLFLATLEESISVRPQYSCKIKRNFFIT